MGYVGKKKCGYDIVRRNFGSHHTHYQKPHKKMNPVIKIAACFIDAFIIAAVISLPTNLDGFKLAMYSAAVILGIVLRITLNKLSNAKDIFRLSMITLPWCFFATIVWTEFLNYQKGFIVYLFVNALFSEFIVRETERGFKEGFRKRLSNIINWAAGNVTPKEAPPKDQEHDN